MPQSRVPPAPSEVRPQPTNEGDASGDLAKRLAIAALGRREHIIERPLMPERQRVEVEIDLTVYPRVVHCGFL